jgi:hypothetical protein
MKFPDEDGTAMDVGDGHRIESRKFLNLQALRQGVWAHSGVPRVDQIASRVAESREQGHIRRRWASLNPDCEIEFVENMGTAKKKIFQARKLANTERHG